ncbi:MAG: hypothetical protein JWN46_273 [Acidimicrobiales bacterium]|nr:hypothetical protein [Acidimicrobiales bacterium]
MTDQKKPVEQALDLFVFAPLGFALEARNMLPKLAERGRQQVTMAKMMGQFAVQQGQHEAGKALTKAQDQAESLLGELGLRPPAEPAAAPTAATTPPATSATPTSAGPAQSGAGASALAISEYDSLAASQVIPRLAALSGAELEAVRSYEAAHRGRKTILNKVAQLQSA